MATSIRLFFDTGIRPEKNAVIEDIGTFLSTKKNLTYPLNRFIQPDTSLSIKIDTLGLPSTIVDKGFATRVVNPFWEKKPDYCGIQNTDKSNKWVYYYVMNKEWTATRTVTLELAIDSLNSFQGSWEFTDRTFVSREHKDRFYQNDIQYGGSTYLARRTYLDSDNVKPALYKKDETTIEDTLNYDWYLLYMANNTSGAVTGASYPVDAYLISGEQITTGVDVYRLKGTALDNTKTYFFGSMIAGSYAADDYLIQPNGERTQLSGVFSIRKPVGENYWAVQQVLGNSSSKNICKFTDYIDFSVIKNLTIVNTADLGHILPLSIDKIPGAVTTYSQGTIAPILDGTEGSISGIDTVDRTDTRILSIIKLPYAPVDITIVNGKLLLPAEVEKSASVKWQNEKTYYYLKIKTDYLSAFKKDITLSKNILSPLFVKKSTITDTRNLDMESALYHSDYYQQRFVYDSFNYPIQDELLDPTFLFTFNSPSNSFKIKMVTTSTMNSRFLFDFNNNGNGIAYEIEDQNYSYIMSVARNNNIVTYNSDYVNYMRNGYNYDVKAKNAALLNAGLGIGASVVSTGLQALSFGGTLSSISKAAAAAKEGIEFETWAQKSMGTQETAGITEGNIAQYKQQLDKVKAQSRTAATLALGQAFTGVSGIINGIQQIQLTESNFQQKQQAIKQASVSVLGSDDIDLLSYYSGNRMKVETWECSDRMKKALGDLYYYQGYSTQEQKIPTHNNRKWFDFLQCQADIKNLDNLDQKFIDNMKDRFTIGVTYYHNVNSQWDLDQTKGNNETWI